MSDSPDDLRPQAEHPVEYLDSAADSTAAGAGANAISDADAAPRRPSSRRRGLVAGAVLAVAVIGGGVAYGVAQLSGGGAQPDEMVPASALAIVSVDLDPSAGQKVDALRFVRAFPALKSRIGSGDDLRKLVFDAVSDSSGVQGAWADVEPWLGDRAAIAVLPAPDELDEPRPVVVLAVTDEGKAKAALPTVLPDSSCEVSDGFALCAKDAATAKNAVADAATKSLADDATYAADADAVGERGIVAAWLDLARVKDAAPDLLAGMGGVTGSLAGATTADLKGRYVAAVRFDGPHLELAAHVEGAELPRPKGSADAGALPQDTLAALGLGDARTVVQSAWDRLSDVADTMGGAGGLQDQVSTIEATYGVTLPDDLVSAVGEQLTLAVGDGSPPRVAVRVTGSADSVQRLVGAVQQASGSTVTLATATSGDATVIASDDTYARAVAEGGGLGGTERFRDAVADPDGAQAVLFVDIAGLVSSYGRQLALDPALRKDVEPLSALGVSLHADGDAFDLRARLVTR